MSSRYVLQSNGTGQWSVRLSILFAYAGIGESSYLGDEDVVIPVIADRLSSKISHVNCKTVCWLSHTIKFSQSGHITILDWSRRNLSRAVSKSIAKSMLSGFPRRRWYLAFTNFSHSLFPKLPQAEQSKQFSRTRPMTAKTAFCFDFVFTRICPVRWEYHKKGAGKLSLTA